MLNFQIRSIPLGICAGLLATWSMPCLAQSPSQPSSVTQKGNTAQTYAAILKELDAMKQRIAELEAQLKASETPAKAQPLASTVAQTGTDNKSKTFGGKAVSPMPNTTLLPHLGTSQTKSAGAVSAPAGGASASPVTAGSESSSLSADSPDFSSFGQQEKRRAKIEPFSDYDWTWLNGNPRTETPAFNSKFFTPEIRADATYTFDFNRPTDHSIGGSSEIFRSQELQLEQLGVGGDFHYHNVRARLMTQFGMYAVTTPRNDASPAHGQWDLADAYRYVSEAYGGYHFNVLDGVNVDAGIFMSYIGLFSYYNFDNWAYQPSYVSSNTPWFFNGVRVQVFLTPHLKIEPWFINGWQSYASANHSPGVGGQIRWTPTGWLLVISNDYGVGEDDVFVPGRRRIHTDDSVEVKYFDRPEETLDRMAFSLTGDLGCEYGAGVSCYKDKPGGPKQSFAGFMAYNRFWLHKNLFGVTIGGGKINNPGRYLVLLPPINGETAVTAATNSPYFTENPGDPFKAWDSSFTFDYMPSQYITFRWEYDYRHASVPYWTGRGGITPPGGNNGSPQDFVCASGVSSGQTALLAAETACGGGIASVWFPDLRRDESFIDMDLLVKF